MNLAGGGVRARDENPGGGKTGSATKAHVRGRVGDYDTHEGANASPGMACAGCAKATPRRTQEAGMVGTRAPKTHTTSARYH